MGKLFDEIDARNAEFIRAQRVFFVDGPSDLPLWRQARRISSGDISRPFAPSSFTACNSIGRPWQSQPGTNGT